MMITTSRASSREKRSGIQAPVCCRLLAFREGLLTAVYQRSFPRLLIAFFRLVRSGTGNDAASQHALAVIEDRRLAGSDCPQGAVEHHLCFVPPDGYRRRFR